MLEQPYSLEQAVRLVEGFGVGQALTVRLANLEAAARRGLRGREIQALLTHEQIDPELIAAARRIKVLAGQINVVMHAAGMMVSLPWILDEGEVVESLSLGAGNTGRDHDLVTDRRIAEFKFIDWRGAADAGRQNSLFADVFSVASQATRKRRIVYVLGTEHPMRFLRGGRAISSVLGQSAKTRRRFHEEYGEGTFSTVRDYWATVSDLVEIADLRELVPPLAGV